MNSATRTLRQASMAALLLAVLLAYALPAAADDTEVLVAPASGNPAAGRANVLFIIDTSGSMDADTATQVRWDAGQEFDGCYRRDALYFATGTQPPPCDSEAYVDKSANRCAAAGPALTALGQWSGAALGWDADQERWSPLSTGNDEQLLECEADRGLDGSGNDRYAANGTSGPWGPDDTQEPAWNSEYTLFDGNWLNWRNNPPTITRSRLEIVQEVVSDIVANLANVNVGLMQFNRNEGGTVTQAVASVDDTRTEMLAAVADLRLLSQTPLSETLYEAALYFRGDSVDYGNVGPILSVPAARQGGTAAGQSYRSPVTAECQKNFIILLSDGEPTADTSANARIAALPEFGALVGNCDGRGDGACLDDLAEYLLEADIRDDLEGQQNVTTYTIGFGIDTNILRNAARRGGGEYYQADDTGSLAAVMRDIVAGIVDRSGTFAAPAIPVNAFGRTAAERDAYISIFQPSGTARWPGNLKKYRFAGGQLVGQDDQPVVDPATGFFVPEAFSFWSAANDGGDVERGGAASRLPGPGSRLLYSDIAGGDLIASGNRINAGNAGITAALLGVEDAARDRLIRWIQGADGNLAEARRQLGDPLHVRPVTLNYSASAADPDTVVFVATNDGVLHAVDADTGVELWGYMPANQLRRQAELFANPQTTVRRYGLDGEIRLFINGNDDRPGISGDERAILLFGMGRGGDTVFAVDVTERDAPQLLWTIDSDTPGFAALGQVWAAPEIARIDIGGEARPVAIITGGYDDAQDNRGFRRDTVGNAVFVVDPLEGTLLWSAGDADSGADLELEAMVNAIPAAPRVIDLTRDGLADRLYVGDMGGRVWRFDIRNGSSAAELVTAGVLASLGAADLEDPRPAAAVRRFYNTPDAVFVNCQRNGTFLAINLGSGYRGHPLDADTEDAFFSIRDVNPYGSFATGEFPAPISVDELEDITTDPAAVVPREARGWLLRLTASAGEKVLSEAATFNNNVFFTSFSPGGAVSTCVGGLGVNRAYQVDACSGRPVVILDGSSDDGPLTLEDRFRVLSQTGIAPEAVFVFPDGPAEGPTRCIGLVCFPPDPNWRNLRRTYWAEQQAADGE